MKIMFIIIRYIQSSTLSILLDFIGEKKIEKVDLMIVMKHVNENRWKKKMLKCLEKN